MSSGSVQAVKEKTPWKQIPVKVGKAAPKYHDLIAFEELAEYDVVNAFNQTPVNAEENGPQKKKLKIRKQDRLKKLKSLTEKLNNNNSDSFKDNNNKGYKENSVKLKKRKGKNQNSEKSKKSKIDQSIKNIVSDAENENTSAKIDMSAWDNLFVPEVVLKALSELGFAKPMPIQEQCFPAAIRDKRDILGAAETGSGKTLAFGIPLLHHLLEDKTRNLTSSDSNDTIDLEDEHMSDFEDAELVKEPDKTESTKALPALVLTPTRELAIQVKNHIMKAAKYSGLWASVVVGGMAQQKQIRLLNKEPDIVIATPGRLWELIESGHPYLSTIHKIRYLVIDEADRMLEHGHFEELSKILEIINFKHSKQKRQTFIFSATLTAVHFVPDRPNFKIKPATNTTENKLSKLMKKIGVRNKPFVIDLTTKKLTAEKLSEAKVICSPKEKDFYLFYFIKSHPGRTLIFTNSIDCIFHLSGVLDALGCNPLHIHAKMQQRQRLKHLDRFQANPDAIMIASDVAARGLDIPGVKHVIHYQVPRTMETYVHRSGRSARSGQAGLSLLFVSPDEMGLYKRICKSLDKQDGLPLFIINESYMAAIKKMVNLAREVDSMSHREKKVRLHNDWFNKAAAAMDMEIDDDMLMPTDDRSDKAHMLKSKRQHLCALLKRPIFPKGFSGKFITKQGELRVPGFIDGNYQNVLGKSTAKNN
uniref:ATP-dependent RNA helicase n=1 Tax=Ciona savignyi TaxID=51511 RepID=H2YAU2_CIOSA